MLLHSQSHMASMLLDACTHRHTEWRTTQGDMEYGRREEPKKALEARTGAFPKQKPLDNYEKRSNYLKSAREILGKSPKTQKVYRNPFEQKFVYQRIPQDYMTVTRKRGLSRSAPNCYIPLSRGLCYKPLSRASV